MILVIGIGNPLRQDDGAGWMLAERMANALHALDAAARVLCVQQLAPEHAVDVVAADVTTVCFADVAVDAPGLRLVALDLKAAPAEYTQVTHQIGPITVLAYAATLGAVVPIAWLLTVGGRDFDHGEGLSTFVQNALADGGAMQAAARRIADLDALQGGATRPVSALE